MKRQSTLNENTELSREDLDLIERFKAAYNGIDLHLRNVLKAPRTDSFSHVVNIYERTKRSFSGDADYLRMIADLRNVLVHGRIEARRYLAVPTKLVVDKLEAILNRLTHPIQVIPTFQREVESFSVNNSLAEVLKKISERDYSQFPIYDKNNFCGVLTENGITRWLAHHVSFELCLVDLEEISISNVLKMEEERQNYLFISRIKSVDDLKELFVDHELLEAILITENGNSNEKLMGIVTRWDVIRINS